MDDWRFNETVTLTLTRTQADAVHNAITFVIEEMEDSPDADLLSPVSDQMLAQTSPVVGAV